MPAYMMAMFADWQAPGITAVLHEQQGGYANNTAAVAGLEGKAEAAGGRSPPGIG